MKEGEAQSWELNQETQIGGGGELYLNEAVFLKK
jgi:hypothetical protein